MTVDEELFCTCMTQSMAESYQHTPKCCFARINSTQQAADEVENQQILMLTNFGS
jgi:hypothetical protein